MDVFRLGLLSIMTIIRLGLLNLFCVFRLGLFNFLMLGLGNVKNNFSLIL